jgi:hypothetical protein
LPKILISINQIGLFLYPIHIKKHIKHHLMRKRTIPTIAFLLCALFSTAQNWNQIIKAAANDRGAVDQFGYSVAISGDYAIVGANSEDEDALGAATLGDVGSAYIFVRSGSTWSQQQKIVASDRAASDLFGTSVAISGDYAIVGADREDEDTSGAATLSFAGSAYIFARSGNTWTQQQKIVASDRAADDFFGKSVAISGDYAIVGADREDEDTSGAATLSGAGSAYIFVRTGSSWTQQQKIVASDRAASDFFGNSVAISGDYAIVGAPFEDEDASGAATLMNAGSVYFFDQNFTLTASAGANGTVTPSGATNVARGGSQTYTITPAAGYCVQDVLVNGSSVGAVTTYTFNNVQANQTISASFVAAPTWYLDADNDNYYTGSGITQCTSPGAGYKSTGLLGGNDCDDNDNTKWQLLNAYADADGDGFTIGAVQEVCSGSAVPQGYSSNSLGEDCNDNDISLSVETIWYLDTDNDGYYIQSISNCGNPGAGYNQTATTQGDCDDNDNTKWQLLNAYVDADGDGFTVGAIQNVCSGNTIPQGYSSSSLGEDTDDNNPDITTGINNLSSANEVVKIYPNPASSMCFIELQNGHGYHSLQLTDVTGKVIRQLVLQPSVTKQKIDISDLSEGMYMVRFVGKTSFGNYILNKQ